MKRARLRVFRTPFLSALPKTFIAIGTLGSLLMTSACLTQRQKARETFADSTLPPALEAIANPPPRATPSAAAATVTVAVIDSGVDYNHPDIAPRIAYDVQDGRITGAGRDFFGDDSWAAPTTFTGDLYALTAQDIVDGKIVRGTQEPKDFLLALDQQFSEMFFTALRRERRFRNTLFANLNADNFSLFGALIVKKRISMNLTMAEGFKPAAPRLGRSRPRAQDLESFERWGISADSLDQIYNLDWRLGSNGTPTSLFTAIIISGEQGEQFARFLVAQVQALEDYQVNGLTLKQAIEHYSEFRNIRNGSEGGEGDVDTALSDMAQAHQTWKIGYRQKAAVDPLARETCLHLPAEQQRSLRATESDAQAAQAFVRSRAEQQLNFMQRVMEAVRNLSTQGERSPEDIENQAAMTRQLRRWPQLRQALLQEQVQQASAIANCQAGDFTGASNERAQRILDSTHNPFAGLDNATTSHGTHVAGIISAQHESIRIFPVRVVTASIERERREDQTIKEKYRREINEWLQLPVISAGVTARFNEAGLSTGSTAEIREQFMGFIENNFDNSRLDFYFIDELAQAMGEVGRRGIKVANISLGTESEDPPASEQKQEEDRVDEVFSNLLFEFFKYKIAKVVREESSQTLFVVAAGNAGKWVDSESRSALPCDLNSLSFSQDALAATLPQNQLDNILCVGSLNENERFSSFTNIPITRNIPFVFSYGESIYSTVSSTDCSGANQEVQRDFGAFPQLGVYDTESNSFRAVLRELGYRPEQYDTRKKREEIMRSDFTAVTSVQAAAYGSLAFSRCLERPARARMSGTSMASPAVAGYIGRWLATQPEQGRNLTPQQIIAGTLNTAPRVGGRSLVSEIPMIVDIFDLDGQRHGEPLQVISRP